MIFPPDVANSLVSLFAELDRSGEVDFIIDTYSPAIILALEAKGVNLGHKTKCRLLLTFVAIMFRFVSATACRWRHNEWLSSLKYDFLNLSLFHAALRPLLARTIHPW